MCLKIHFKPILLTTRESFNPNKSPLTENVFTKRAVSRPLRESIEEFHIFRQFVRDFLVI